MYNPQNNLLTGIRNLFPLEICPWDDYYMRMAQTDFLAKRNKPASKTFFIRKAPFGGSYAIFGGLTEFLRTLNDFLFRAEDVWHALLDMGYKEDFIEYLRNQGRLNVKVYACKEGSVIFPNEPIVILEGNLIDVRIAEGMLLKSVNFPTLSLTKWARVNLAAAPGSVLEFSRRRAQDSLRTTLYGYLGGCSITSNADIRKAFDIPVRGTMGHEFVQSYGDEFAAFDAWLQYNPDKPVLLVDTIDTLKSGVPNAIKAFKKHQEAITNAGGVMGIRNDSGDLAYITLEEFREFSKANLLDIKIYETNDLDEYSIENIREQIMTNGNRMLVQPKMENLIWACGTMPGTCYDQPSLGGVAKLSSIEVNGEEKAVIKIAGDNPIKTSIPGSNRSHFVFNKEKELVCCLIAKKNETNFDYGFHPEDESKGFLFKNGFSFEKRQELVYDRGVVFNTDVTLSDVRERVREELEMLHWSVKRFKNPHTVKVSLSRDLFKLRKDLISNKWLIEP